MALEKIRIREDKGGGREFEVLFNPEQYTVSRGNNFAQVAVPGLSSPLLQFSHGELRTLQMELLFDSREKHVVANRTRTEANSDLRLVLDQFLGLMDIDPDTHAPPVLLFVWGSLTFRCVLVSASQKFTLFKQNGDPLRATVTVTFNEYVNAEMEAKFTKRKTADYTKTHEVAEGDTLPGIAYAAYGDAALWRPIALRNGLTDPRRLPVGVRLVVPRLPYRDPGTDRTFA
jgi:nucleoid-associated protein YgaU